MFILLCYIYFALMFEKFFQQTKSVVIPPYKNFFYGLIRSHPKICKEPFLEKYKENFVFRARKVHSWNIRSLELKNSISRNIRNFCRVIFLRSFFKKFHFPKYKKRLFFRKYEKFVNLRARKFNFQKYKKNFQSCFFRKKYKKFFSGKNFEAEARKYTG